MHNIHYHRVFNEFTTDALLHLYSYIASSSRFMPKTKRNELLLKFFKQQIVLPRNVLIKKDIKLLVFVAKKGGNAEARLNELHQFNLDYNAKQTDAEVLNLLVYHLYEDHGFESMLDEQDLYRENKVIYTNQKALSTSFDEHNRFIAPLSFYIDSLSAAFLVQAINEMGTLFCAERGIIDENKYSQVILKRVPE
ncbi:DUF2913 family protein [Aliivibrio salmonicida]|uniref:DUF2913 family protein n=1 Tax=Aliivibrio salmonicida TaxID=40269 RepID=UPI003D124A67